MSYSMLIGAGVSVAAIVGAYFVGSDAGEKKERTKWQGANVETLIDNNDNLKDVLNIKEGNYVLAEQQDIYVGNQIEGQTTEVTERIIQVPVDRVVTVEVPVGCDGGDIDISYDTIRLFNAWADGTSLERRPERATTRDVPLVGSSEVPGEFTGDGYQ